MSAANYLEAVLALADQIKNKKGLHFIEVAHDDWCPGQEGSGKNCICNATVKLVTEDKFVDGTTATLNRARRRAAARQKKQSK